ncbi:MAG: hypothetical protein WBF41_14070, partial [Candidatus Sulfotelmatobacter sp.]
EERRLSAAKTCTLPTQLRHPERSRSSRRSEGSPANQDRAVWHGHSRPPPLTLRWTAEDGYPTWAFEPRHGSLFLGAG